MKQIKQVAPSDESVLIHGESGTGKELLANAIHKMSLRCDERLVKVNCAALPSELIESELFGYERGAFTGATSRQIGSFELADHGTIFLDEIGELPLSLQGKLLRILQEGEFKRLGNPKVRKVNVRILAATNKSLDKAVEKGTFREDLFFRLNVFPVKTIPLRERKGDILLLVKHFCEQYGTRLGKNVNYLPQRTLDLLEAYSWPGNVRELANMIERALIISSSDKLEVMQAWFLTKKNLPNKELKLSLREFEKEYILYTLESTNWRIRGEKGAAKILDLPPSTLESKMKKLNISRKKLNL